MGARVFASDSFGGRGAEAGPGEGGFDGVDGRLDGCLGYWRRETACAADLTGFEDDEPMDGFRMAQWLARAGWESAMSMFEAWRNRRELLAMV